MRSALHALLMNGKKMDSPCGHSLVQVQQKSIVALAVIMKSRWQLHILSRGRQMIQRPGDIGILHVGVREISGDLK